MAYKQRKTFHRQVKKETTFKLLDKEKFFRKMHGPPPQWMTEQISLDLADFKEGISQNQVDHTFAHIKKNLSHPAIVRYRVINGELYRYFPEGELISIRDNSTEKALKGIIRCGKFQTLDFIFSYLDGIPVDGMPQLYHLTEKKEWQAPVFFSAKDKNVPYIILIPDWRSISKWWASNIKTIESISAKVPWDQKKNFALWRGSLTRRFRTKLCQISSEHPQYLDAKINDTLDDKEAHKQLEKQGLFGEPVSWEEFLSCKYLPTVDGVCCAAPALQWRLLSRCITLKQESNEVQWFYRALMPYKHYIPIQKDLSDLIEKIQWAKDHDQECKAMAEQSYIFARDHLMMEDVFLYFYLVLKKYASLQTLDMKQLKKEILADPHWINIQNRKRLKKLAEIDPLHQYTNLSTPFPH